MLEYDDLNDFIAAETKKDRDKASDSGRLLKADSVIGERLKNLRHKYKLKFGVAFDATGKQRRAKGWLANYVVLDLTLALPSKKSEIPDDLYQDAMEIFRRAETILDRSRTFFVLRIVPRLKKQAWSWSVALLLNTRDLAGTHVAISKTAGEFLSLTVGHSAFKAQYSNAAHALCLYSQRDKCIYAFPSEAPITFSDHYRDCDEVEQSVLSDKCGGQMRRGNHLLVRSVFGKPELFPSAASRSHTALATGRGHRRAIRTNEHRGLARHPRRYEESFPIFQKSPRKRCPPQFAE
jgi:hypothetical protein